MEHLLVLLLPLCNVSKFKLNKLEYRIKNKVKTINNNTIKSNTQLDKVKQM